MARPLRIQYPGAFYHVSCRGNERRSIFLDDSDHLRFEKLLSESLEMFQVVLYVYVLMGNHFHLVVQTKRANLSEFMRRFNICYTAWFNHHHSRCGHLYQGRYHALLVDADKYLMEVSRYGHLNPVRLGKFRKMDHHERWHYVRKYRWSSLPGYLTEKAAVGFVDYTLVLKMAGGRRAYQEFLMDGLKKGMENPFDNVQHQTILGDSGFVDRIKNERIGKGSMREQPTYRRIIETHVEPTTLMVCVAEVLGIKLEGMRARLKNGVERGIVAELLYRYSDITQSEIGELLGGIDYTAVSRLRCRLRMRIEHEYEVKRKFLDAEKSVVTCQV